MEFTKSEIVKKHKSIRLVQRKGESWEEFKERINATKERCGDNYLTQTQPVREVVSKGIKNVRRTYVNIILKEEVSF
nr:MAG TPA: hypothetical protein [Caudoviricetes sp.]